MKKHSTANILLVELLIVILFFMLCVSTLVDIFGMAKTRSAAARAMNSAMLTAENLTALIRSADDPGAELERNGFEAADGGWTLTADDFIIHASEAEEKTAAGVLRTVTFAAERKNGDALFELPAVKYIPGEVSP